MKAAWPPQDSSSWEIGRGIGERTVGPAPGAAFAAVERGVSVGISSAERPTRGATLRSISLQCFQARWAARLSRDI